MADKKEYRATGKRKRSIAQVILVVGSGKITVNGRDVNDYMPYPVLVTEIEEPLVLAESTGKFDIEVKVSGGGFSGQAGAIRHAISKALLETDSGNRAILKKSGMITRDARIKERKKYGLKKARRAPQFSKR